MPRKLSRKGAYKLILAQYKAQGGWGPVGDVYDPETGRYDPIGAIAKHYGWTPDVRPSVTDAGIPIPITWASVCEACRLADAALGYVGATSFLAALDTLRGVGDKEYLKAIREACNRGP